MNFIRITPADVKNTEGTTTRQRLKPPTNQILKRYGSLAKAIEEEVHGALASSSEEGSEPCEDVRGSSEPGAENGTGVDLRHYRGVSGGSCGSGRSSRTIAS